MKNKVWAATALVVAAGLGLSACSGGGGAAGVNESPGGGGSDGASSDDLGSATILTNWFAQAEQGPYWAAEAEGLAEDRGVDLSVEQGGPGIQTVPQVAAGEADFGVANADEIAVAVSNGLPIVAVMPGFDQNIQCLAYHEATGIEDFDDLNGFTVAQSLIPYWDYIKLHYELDDVEEVNIGSLATFEADPDLVQQCFITSEPYTLEQDGQDDVGYLLVRDSGFNPYQNMLFSTRSFIESHPDVVDAVVQASIEGWSAFLDDPAKTKELILEVNSDMDPDMIDYALDKIREEPSLLGDPIGAQSDERWSTLKDQLVEIGMLPDDFDMTTAYTTEFSNQ